MSLEYELHDALERRDVAADTDLTIFMGNAGRAQRHHLDRTLRRRETLQRALAKRIQRHDGRATSRGVVQLGHHPWAVRAGILSDHKNCVDMGEVVQDDGAFTDTDAFGQADACRLVTHVRTVGEVICAEAAYEQLV